jgi:DNA modification methylase
MTTPAIPDLVIEPVPIGSLVPDPANPRRIDEDEFDALTRSVTRWGMVQPILARRSDRVVIGGHQRLLAARRAGLAEVPVAFLELSADEAHLLNLALNRIGGDWDEALLARLLTELGNAPDVDLSLSGFGDDEVRDLLRRLAAAERADRVEDFDIDAAVERARAEPRSRRGDLWIVGDHRLLCGDATDRADVERLLDGRRAQVMWTDPPYGVSYVGKTSDALTIRNDDPDGLAALLRDAFACATDALEPGAPVYVARPAGPNGLPFLTAVVDAGWRFHQELVWVKDSMVLGHSDYHYRHEPIVYAWTAGPGRSGRGRHRGSRWIGPHDATSVFEVARPKASPDHPTGKPVALVTAMLANHAGDVYDPFAGSGTTLVAADKLGRASYAMELDPVYVDVIVARWEAWAGGTAVLAERLDVAA